MKNNIGFIGIGVMGESIVKHLLKAGFNVTVYTTTKAKAQAVLQLGAKWAETPAQAAQQQHIIFTMVGTPTDVEQVYFDKDGIFQTVQQGAVVIDMTTSEPSLAKKIYEHARAINVYALDAPVSGGDIGAQNGTLSIMVGGDKNVFDNIKPIFSIFGTNIMYQGDAGAGQHTKMCNQIVACGNMIGVCESLAYGLKAGLDLDTMLQSISTGAASSWALVHLAPKIIQNDFAPGFFIKHFVKDMKIALQEAEKMNLSLSGLQLVKEIYETLEQAGYGENGTQALIKHYI